MTIRDQAGPWRELLDRWDAQQTVYIEHRDRVYDVMFEVLTHLRPGDDPTVLDLACGPGAISARLLHRLPKARSVAVDIDPVLLAIGRGALGDVDGRLRWVRADLRDPDWTAALGADSAAGTFDAVLSSTALHWLDPATLVATYRRAYELLRPGGVLLNADYLPHPAQSRLRQACDALALHRRNRALGAGAESWEAWWDAAAAEPALADAFALRATLWPEGARDWAMATHHFHEAALQDAGFAEAGIVWQDLQERIIAGLR
ncbi:trans-aconitate 2-methyltransferase [Plantactinospora sp. KBS50]|uniref:class I SAM-dependent methyltransferase n=1 Tax=Plantactinospora sp. KBS50 TaxID=2024580 RepID=UPI000BAABACD|nr:class I SAM-dependent methyltransferase [Plantactinospora sp. KBS50]ASW56915.1 16S rRNA (cytosine(1402)-N(4))-methyltransferase [Plantactinospora sp. KBS50]